MRDPFVFIQFVLRCIFVWTFVTAPFLPVMDSFMATQIARVLRLVGANEHLSIFFLGVDVSGGELLADGAWNSVSDVIN